MNYSLFIQLYLLIRKSKSKNFEGYWLWMNSNYVIWDILTFKNDLGRWKDEF